MAHIETTASILPRDNYHVAYSQYGDPDGDPIILSHGFLMNSDMFTELAWYLAQSGYWVIRVDARAHGNTIGVSPGYTYWDLADDLVAVMDALDIPSAHLLGHSQGGFTSLRAALANPHRVRSLILVSSEAEAPDEDTRNAYRGMAAACSTGVPDELANALASSLIGEPEREEVWKAVWHTMDMVALSAAWETLTNRDSVTERLPEIQVPTLLMRGERDEGVDESTQLLLDERLGSSTVVRTTIAGAAHASPLTHAEIVAELVVSFLSNISTSQSGATVR